MSDHGLDGYHGTANGYCNRECRCQACRTAWAAYIKEQRDRKARRLAGEVDRYLGRWRLYNLNGELTAHVAVITNAKVRRTGHLGKSISGWMTVNGQIIAAPTVVKAIDDGLLRLEPQES